MVTQFKLYLAKTNLAENTIASYVWTVTYFLEHYKEVNKKNLLAYKGYLVENFTSNGESEITSCKQVLGVQQTGETKDEVCKGAAEELLGECYQRC